MTGSGNWTYLLPGSSPVLIDAGTGRAGHLDALFAQAPDGPAVVLVTHGHPDHASGAPAIAARAPRARFAKFPWPDRDALVAVSWTALADGERLDTGAGPLEVVHTPGHSPDHVVFWHTPSRTAFVGDLLVQGSTVVIPASHGGSLTQYLASLERVAGLRPARALPAHGPVIDDPLGLIAHYVAHRLHREQQILEALDRRRLVDWRHRRPHLCRTRPGPPRAGARQRPRASRQARRRRPRRRRRGPVATALIAHPGRWYQWPQRGVVPHQTAMDKIVDFINVNRDRYVDAAEGIPRHPEHQRAAAARRRRAALRRVDGGRDAAHRPAERRASMETPGHPVVYGEWLGAAGRADDPLLRPLRRAAGRSGEAVDLAAVRGDDSRRRDLRPRLGRRQGPGLHALQGGRGAHEADTAACR